MSVGSLVYSVETGVTIAEFRDVLNGSGLGSRRPVDDAKRLGAMLANANLIVTARINGELVGIGSCPGKWCMNRDSWEAGLPIS